MDFQERIAFLSQCPIWAITEEKLESLLTGVLAIFSIEALRPKTLGSGKGNKVVIIPVQGLLTKDQSWAGSTYGMIQNAVADAAADPSVKHIILDVDSPGGEITGLPETASIIAAAAKVKPVTAHVDGDSASAAYWLTSQAREVVMSPSSQVGSVGVRATHVDVSKMLDDAGYKVTEMHAGKFKTEWSPYKPLTDEAKADMQAKLNAGHADFIKGVADGRGPRASAEITAARFGEGRMFDAKAALGHGLADKVQSSREFYQAIVPAQEEQDTRIPFPVRARLGVEKIRF